MPPRELGSSGSADGALKGGIEHRRGRLPRSFFVLGRLPSHVQAGLVARNRVYLRLLQVTDIGEAKALCIHGLLCTQGVMPATIGKRSYAVRRTAIRGHDGRYCSPPSNREFPMSDSSISFRKEL
jgi:hypothetical protein